MSGWRQAFICLLMLLPAVLVLSVGGYYVVTSVPKAVYNEPRRIGRVYREQAEEFIAHPERATYVGDRVKGWRQTSRIGGVSWGVENADGLNDMPTRIWFRSGEREWRAMVVETIRPFPFRMVFYGGGIAVAIVLLWLSALAVRFFLRFTRERDDFLAATAHDLTTPLVGMRMMIGRDDEEARRLNERMLILVDNINGFLRLGGRRKDPDCKVFDIVALCQEAYALFAADYADAESGPVVFHQTQTSHDQVSADELMTLQILWNLFGNDLKYAAPYGKVEVRIERDGSFVKVEFVDEGQGMTARQRKYAFNRYYRAKTVLQSGKGGFGIGLCTSREFARIMGGDLVVRANKPKGCVFTLTLPCAIG